MTIREYRQEDYPQIKEIINNSLKEIVSKYYSEEVILAIRKFYTKDNIKKLTKVFIFENRNNPVGCIALNKNEAKMLYIEPSCKIKGEVAEKLLMQAKKFCIENKYKIMTGEALNSSINFCLKIGAKIISKKEEKIENIPVEVNIVEWELKNE